MGKPVGTQPTPNFEGQAGDQPHNRRQIRLTQLASAIPESNSDAASVGQVTVESRVKGSASNNDRCSFLKMFLGNMAISLCLPSSRQTLPALNSAPFPEVIRDLLLGHAIEGDADSEMMLACVGLPETEHEGRSLPRFSTGLEPLMEGDRS
jgi:hypothetical protein